jgi:hypothetical protein
MRADLQIRLAPAARVFEKTIFGRFFQMRSSSGADQSISPPAPAMKPSSDTLIE